MGYRNEEDGSTSVGDALDAGMALGEPKAAGGADYAVVPEGANLQDLEDYQAAPRRIHRTVAAHSLAGFLAYWALQANAAAGNATIYADRKSHLVIGILDDDRPGAPAWKQHRVTYGCPHSLEWDLWSSLNGRMQSQAEFARVIEEAIGDIAEPAADAILKLALTLDAKKSVTFSQSSKLETGSTSLRYTEEISGSDVTGAIELPKGFVLGIPVFLGGPRYRVPVLLRYKIPNGAGQGLQMGIVIDRPAKIIDAAFDEALLAVKEGTKVEQIIEARPD